jgi:hypothetical protein
MIQVHWTTLACIVAAVGGLVMAVREASSAGDYDFGSPFVAILWVAGSAVTVLLLLLARAWGWA